MKINYDPSKTKKLMNWMFRDEPKLKRAKRAKLPIKPKRIRIRKPKPIKPLSTRSKYFDYITNEEVESRLITLTGVIAIVPKLWRDRTVRITYGDGYSTTAHVLHYTTRTFVRCPAFYLGQKARVTLI